MLRRRSGPPGHRSRAETKRLDKLEEAIHKSTDVAEALNYATRVCQTLVTSREFRREVLTVLVRMYESDHVENNYLNVCQCLMFLDDADGVAAILTRLVEGEEDDQLWRTRSPSPCARTRSKSFFRTSRPSWRPRKDTPRENGADEDATMEDGEEDKKERNRRRRKRRRGEEDGGEDRRRRRSPSRCSAWCSPGSFRQPPPRVSVLAQRRRPPAAQADAFRGGVEELRVPLRDRALQRVDARGHHRGYFPQGEPRLAQQGDELGAVLGDSGDGRDSPRAAQRGPHADGTLPAPRGRRRGCAPEPLPEGGALYALGLIHANHGEGILPFLLESSRSSNNEVIQHGACLGLGLAALGSGNEEVFTDMFRILRTDGAIAGEGAGVGMGLLLAGSGAVDKQQQILNYCHKAQHEKIIRGCSVGLALTAYGREEEAEPLIEQMVRDSDPIIRYGACLATASAYVATGKQRGHPSPLARRRVRRVRRRSKGRGDVVGFRAVLHPEPVPEGR